MFLQFKATPDADTMDGIFRGDEEEIKSALKWPDQKFLIEKGHLKRFSTRKKMVGGWARLNGPQVSCIF